MAFGLKGVSRDWGPGIVRVAGSFTVASNAIVTTGGGAQRPSRPGWTVTRKAAGVYQVTLSQAFLSVEAAYARVGPATGLGTTNFATVTPVDAMITQDFFTASTTQWVVDATNKNLVITTTTGGALTDVTANYRCGFIILLCESAVNK